MGWSGDDVARILGVMAETALIPAWVAPTPQAVADCHWIAHVMAKEAGPRSRYEPGSRYTQVVAVMDWVTTGEPTRDQAVDMMMASDGAAYDTVAWLLGHHEAPVKLPRRNPDGSVVTETQLYGEYMTGLTGLPEQRRDAEQRARKDAASYRWLAALVPH